MFKLLLVLVSCISTCVIAEESKPIADAGIVICDNPPSIVNLSRWVKSKVGFSAAAELRNEVIKSGDSRHCVTSWRLHVRKHNESERVITVGQRDDIPEDNEWIEENSFQIDGWSVNGKVVVASRIEAQGDWDETTPIVFNFTTMKYSTVNLLPLFEGMIPADCYVLYRTLGVSNNGTVLLSAFSTDDDRDAGTPQCFPESRWRVSLKDRTLTRVGPRRNTRSR